MEKIRELFIKYYWANSKLMEDILYGINKYYAAKYEFLSIENKEEKNKFELRYKKIGKRVAGNILKLNTIMTKNNEGFVNKLINIMDLDECSKLVERISETLYKRFD